MPLSFSRTDFLWTRKKIICWNTPLLSSLQLCKPVRLLTVGNIEIEGLHKTTLRMCREFRRVWIASCSKVAKEKFFTTRVVRDWHSCIVNRITRSLLSMDSTFNYDHIRKYATREANYRIRYAAWTIRASSSRIHARWIGFHNGEQYYQHAPVFINNDRSFRDVIIMILYPRSGEESSSSPKRGHGLGRYLAGRTLFYRIIAWPLCQKLCIFRSLAQLTRKLSANLL